MHTITINDENAVGKLLNKIELAFEQEFVTVEKLIKSRVEYEVRQFNNSQSDYFNGFVRPTEAEKTLNGYKPRKGNRIDAEKQVYIALDAFNKNAFFILVDDKQVENLKEKVLVSKETSVSFIKLTPLVGG